MGMFTEDEEKERLAIENDELKREIAGYKIVIELNKADAVVYEKIISKNDRWILDSEKTINRQSLYLSIITGMFLSIVFTAIGSLCTNEVWVGDVCLSCWGKP